MVNELVSAPEPATRPDPVATPAQPMEAYLAEADGRGEEPAVDSKATPAEGAAAEAPAKAPAAAKAASSAQR